MSKSVTRRSAASASWLGRIGHGHGQGVAAAAHRDQVVAVSHGRRHVANGLAVNLHVFELQLAHLQNIGIDRGQVVLGQDLQIHQRLIEADACSSCMPHGALGELLRRMICLSSSSLAKD